MVTWLDTVIGGGRNAGSSSTVIEIPIKRTKITLTGCANGVVVPI